MNKLKLIVVMLSTFPFFAQAGYYSTQPWFREDTKYIYYYIDTDTRPDSIKKYLALQLDHGWELDLTGFPAEGSPRILARLRRDRTKEINKDDRLLPNSPAWFNKILRSNTSSYTYTSGMQEAYSHFKEISKTGYKMALMKQPLSDMSNITITYYRGR